MSSSRRGRRSQSWWCHQCNGTVRLPNANTLICPRCGGGFIEEVDNSDLEDDAMNEMMHSLAAFLQEMPHNPRAFNPLIFLQDQMQNLARDEIMPRRLFQGNIGDYFLGPGLDRLIQQLAENDPNRYGTPPASKASVEAMETIKIVNEGHLGSADASQCAICKDGFEEGTYAKEMPCKHLYHSDCILPWLARHNSCPVCRYEMPTDDPEYDGIHRRGPNNSAVSGRIENAVDGLSLRNESEGESNNRNESNASEAPNYTSYDANTPNRQSGTSVSPGQGRRRGVPYLWPFRTLTTTSQQVQAETSSGPASSGQTVSSQLNNSQGNSSEGSMTDADGDTLMLEAREQDLD